MWSTFVSCSTQRMTTRGTEREEATAQNRGSHESETPANRMPGFRTSVLLGDAFVEVNQVMLPEQTTAKLSKVYHQRVIHSSSGAGLSDIRWLPGPAAGCSCVAPSSQRKTSCLPGKENCRLQNGKWAFTVSSQGDRRHVQD